MTSGSPSRRPRPRRSTERLIAQVASVAVVIVGGILATLAGDLLGSGLHSANPGPTVSAAPSPTPTATPTGTASPAPTVAVVLPSAISITINDSGRTPAWVTWLGPAGGFLAGVGALGGLVAFRRSGPPAGPAARQEDDS